jgi:hypothetical protein
MEAQRPPPSAKVAFLRSARNGRGASLGEQPGPIHLLEKACLALICATRALAIGGTGTSHALEGWENTMYDERGFWRLVIGLRQGTQ